MASSLGLDGSTAFDRPSFSAFPSGPLAALPARMTKIQRQIRLHSTSPSCEHWPPRYECLIRPPNTAPPWSARSASALWLPTVSLFIRCSTRDSQGCAKQHPRPGKKHILPKESSWQFRPTLIRLLADLHCIIQGRALATEQALKSTPRYPQPHFPNSETGPEHLRGTVGLKQAHNSKGAC